MNNILLEIAIIIFFALIGSVLAIRFKQIPLLGLLLAGAIIGPYSFHLVSDINLINILIDIGSILLLFTIGIEHDLDKLSSLGIKPVLIALFKVGFVFFISYESAILLNFHILTAIVIGIILSFTSTVVFVRILAIKNLIKREENSLLIGVLIVEDILAIFLLTIVSGIGTSAIDPLDIFFRLIFSLLLLIIAYGLLIRFLKPAINYLTTYRSRDTFTFIALVLCFGLSYSAILLHVSPTIGAFLAGSLVARLQKSKEFEAEIIPFSLTFSSIFFLTIGMLIDYHAILNQWPIILFFCVVSLIAKFFGTSIGMFFLHKKDGESAIFSGLALLSLGEFSLLIAKESSSFISDVNILGLVSPIIFLSVLANSFSIDKIDFVHSFFKRTLPKKFIRVGEIISSHFIEIMRAFDPNGSFILASKKRIKLIFLKAISLFGVIFILLLIAKYKLLAVKIPFGIYIIYGIYAGLGIIILVLLWKILYALYSFINDLAKALVHETLQESAEKRFLQKIIIGAICIFISYLLPTIIGLLALPRRLQIVSPVFFVFGLFYIWRASSLIGTIVKKKYTTIVANSKKNK